MYALKKFKTGETTKCNYYNTCALVKKSFNIAKYKIFQDKLE